jgi:hypothetical protein
MSGSRSVANARNWRISVASAPLIERPDFAKSSHATAPTSGKFSRFATSCSASCTGVAGLAGSKAGLLCAAQ